MAGFGDDVFARWSHIQSTLFPWLREELNPVTAALEQLIIVLDTIGLAAYVPGPPRYGRGRKPEDRRALARAFVAKAVLGLPTTAAVIERLAIDKSLRRICGWESAREVPSEATFSRAFAEFAASELPDQLHEALIKRTLADRIVGCVARDATEIDAREKPAKSGKSGPGPGDSTAPPPPSATPPAAAEPPAPRRRGRPKKGEERPKTATRLERQATQSLPEMLAELPTGCDVGSKRNSKGYKHSWTGYKLHIDVADGQIPVACLLTSASVHDSQVAIPLMTLTGQRIDYLYDLSLPGESRGMPPTMRHRSPSTAEPSATCRSSTSTAATIPTAKPRARPRASAAPGSTCPTRMMPSTTSAPWPSASTPASKTSSAVNSCACAAPSKRAAT